MVQPPFKRLNRGRQDEDADGPFKFFAHLTSALPIDFKEHVIAPSHLGLDPGAARAVVVTMDVSAFEEFTARLHLEEHVFGDEVVFAAVHFTGPRVARGIGN